MQHKNYGGTSTHRAQKYMKQKLIKLKGETNNSKMKGEALNTPLSKMYRKTKQKFNEEINQLDQQTSTEYSTQQQQNILI